MPFPAAATAQGFGNARLAASSTEDPTVFIHGIDSNENIWDRAVAQFEERKYEGAVFTFDYSSTWEEPIAKTAERFSSWVIGQGLQGKRINVVGHSLGGLIARQAAYRHRTFQLGSLVTLATPHYGARWAGWCNIVAGVCPSAIEQMSPDSTFLETLNAATESWSNRQSTLAISIGRDEAVFLENSQLRGAGFLTVAADATELPKTTSEAGVGTGTWASRGGRHGSLPFKVEAINAAFDFIVRGNHARILPAGPSLYGADCTVWSFTNGTVRWRLPELRPEGVKVEIVEKTTAKAPIIVPIEKQVVENLWYGDYNFRFVGPESPGKTHWVSEWSSVNLRVVGARCRSDITNRNPVLTSFPGPSNEAVSQVIATTGRVQLEIDRTFYTQANRYLVYIDGRYAMETFSGSQYYATKISEDERRVVLEHRTDSIKPGSKIEVYLGAGYPGVDASTKTILQSVIVAD